MADLWRNIDEIQQRLSYVATELVDNSWKLQSAQAELRQAIRRAEESEKIQKDLQAENAHLVRSLEEERPKIIDLSKEKAELIWEPRSGVHRV
jgi:chromosome segregation ATPase